MTIRLFLNYFLNYIFTKDKTTHQTSQNPIPNIFLIFPYTPYTSLQSVPLSPKLPQNILSYDISFHLIHFPYTSLIHPHIHTNSHTYTLIHTHTHTLLTYPSLYTRKDPHHITPLHPYIFLTTLHTSFPQQLYFQNIHTTHVTPPKSDPAEAYMSLGCY